MSQSVGIQGFTGVDVSQTRLFKRHRSAIEVLYANTCYFNENMYTNMLMW